MPRYTISDILVVIPAYNEEETIVPTVEKIKRYTNNIVVVDDGSTDKTASLARGTGVKVISYQPNQGKGMALQAGRRFFLEETEFEIMLIMDGDGQHQPKYIPLFINKFNSDPEIDFVLASRFGTDDWVYNMPFLRKISNLLSRFGLWVLYFGYVVEDPQNGFRAFDRKALKILDFKPQFPKERYGFEAETEILIDARIHGLKHGTIHIQSLYFDDRISKFSLFMDTWKIPGVMVKNFFARKPWLYRRRF